MTRPRSMLVRCRPGQGAAAPEPEIRVRRPKAGRRVGATLPLELYVAFKAFVARRGSTGEEALVDAVRALVEGR